METSAKSGQNVETVSIIHTVKLLLHVHVLYTNYNLQIIYNYIMMKPHIKGFNHAINVI